MDTTTMWVCDICGIKYDTYSEAEECEIRCEKQPIVGLTLGGGVYGPSPVEGRDMISKKTVFKPNKVIQAMMTNMGWIPGMGLGARLQGIAEPVDTEPQCVRYFPQSYGGRGGIGYY